MIGLNLTLANFHCVCPRLSIGSRTSSPSENYSFHNFRRVSYLSIPRNSPTPPTTTLRSVDLAPRTLQPRYRIHTKPLYKQYAYTNKFPMLPRVSLRGDLVDSRRTPPHPPQVAPPPSPPQVCSLSNFFIATPTHCIKMIRTLLVLALAAVAAARPDSDYEFLFASWRKQHLKEYSTAEEAIARFNIFRQEHGSC